MDDLMVALIFVILSTFSVIISYLISKSTIHTVRSRIAKAVHDANAEVSSRTDIHVIFEDYPARLYTISLVLLSLTCCCISSAVILDRPWYASGEDGIFLFGASGILVFGLGLVILYNLAQRYYSTTLVIVSEEGIDLRKFNESGQKSVMFIRWGEITGFRIGTSRQSANHVQVNIKSDHGKITLWAWWTNYQFLEEKMQRLNFDAYYKYRKRKR